MTLPPLAPSLTANGQADGHGRATFRIWRGDAAGGAVRGLHDRRSPRAWSCSTPIHQIQAEQANDLAVRWNCKAGKCGSCSAEINGKPQADVHDAAERARPLDEPVTVEPMRAFPPIKRPGDRRVVELPGQEDASSRSSRGRPTRPTAPGGWQQADVDRVQEFRKCIECFLCQDVCHVLRDHHMHDEFIGPRFLVYAAALEMHPLDTEDRVPRAARTRTASATATSPSAAPRSARSTSPSPTTRSSRSRSGWSTSSTIRWASCCKLFSRREQDGDRCSSSSSRSRGTAFPRRWRRRSATGSQRALGGREHLPRRARGRPDNQEALVTLLLALTDQFARGPAEGRAPGPGAAAAAGRRVQAGLLRRASSASAAPRRSCAAASIGSGELAYHWFREAMELVREGRGPAAGRQRRGDPALEHLRADPGARRAHQAAGGGLRWRQDRSRQYPQLCRQPGPRTASRVIFRLDAEGKVAALDLGDGKVLAAPSRLEALTPSPSYFPAFAFSCCSQFSASTSSLCCEASPSRTIRNRWPSGLTEYIGIGPGRVELRDREQRPLPPDAERGARRDLRRDHLALAVDVEQLAAAGGPGRLAAAGGGHLPLGRRGLGERADVDLRRARLVRAVRQPAAVGRDGGEQLRRGRGDQRDQRRVAGPEAQDVAVPAAGGGTSGTAASDRRASERAGRSRARSTQQQARDAGAVRPMDIGRARAAAGPIGDVHDVAAVGRPGRAHARGVAEGDSGEGAVRQPLDPDVAPAVPLQARPPPTSRPETGRPIRSRPAGPRRGPPARCRPPGSPTPPAGSRACRRWCRPPCRSRRARSRC